MLRPVAAQVVLRRRRRASRRCVPNTSLRRRPDEVLGQRGHGVVIAVRLVGLEHRELGRVRGVGALVAEIAVDLEHPLDVRRRRRA